MILPSGILFKKGSLRFLEIRSHCKKVLNKKSHLLHWMFFPGEIVSAEFLWPSIGSLIGKQPAPSTAESWGWIDQICGPVSGTGLVAVGFRPFGSLFWRYSSEVIEWSSKSALKDSQARILLATDHQIIWFSALPKRGFTKSLMSGMLIFLHQEYQEILILSLRTSVWERDWNSDFRWTFPESAIRTSSADACFDPWRGCSLSHHLATALATCAPIIEG